MSTLFASAVFSRCPNSQSLTRLRTLQKLGLGERDLARGPVFSVPFVFFVPVVFFFGVAEPIYHYAVSPNRFTADHAMPDNSLAQQAILLTFYHWGLHPWSVYTVVGLLLGLMAHR